MDEAIADYALRILNKKKVSYGEARLTSYRSSGFMMKNGVLQIGGFDLSAGLGIRFIVDGCIGFASSNLLSRNDVAGMISKSISLAKKSKKLVSPAGFSSEKAHKADYKVSQKRPIENVSAKEKVGILKDIESGIAKTKVSVPGRFLSLSDGISEKVFINTEGTRIKSIIPRVNFHYYLTVAASTSMQRYWQFGAAKGYEAFDEWLLPDKLSGEVISMNKTLKDGIKFDSQFSDVVVGPEVVGIMCHESVGHPYEADRILGREGAQAGESFVKQSMLGSRIGSKAVTVVDDPALPHSFGFYLYDDEGVKARRRFLMKNGLINEFLHNRESAYLMNIKNNGSNGSGRAVAFNREPIVRMANTFLLPGDYKGDELISETRRGIYMKNFTEWNIDDKRFNQKYSGCECWRIRNGRLAERLRDVQIEITTPQLWSGVDAVSDNVEYHAGTCGKGEPMQGIPVWFGGPDMRLKNIRLSANQK